MSGTNLPVMVEIRSMPPKRTTLKSTKKTTLVTHSGMEKLAFSAFAIELA